MSAAYLSQELKSEFGSLPPSFLPLGNKRLFQYQVGLAEHSDDIYLSVPDTYLVSEKDREWLSNHNVKLIYTPTGLSLGASFVAALNLAESDLSKPMKILFGDTLFDQFPSGTDIVGVSKVKDSYDWAMVTFDDKRWVQNTDEKSITESEHIVSGYFKISSPRKLLRYVTQNNWNFLEGINKYHSKIGLSAMRMDSWLDFGHVNTYYRSKVDFTTQRAFNELKITPKWIEKSSRKSLKIKAEANWFESIPYALRSYIPQFLGSESKEGNIAYRLEYLHLTALNELYVYSELPDAIWKQILLSCLEFIEDCSRHSLPEGISYNSLEHLFGEKTKVRLNEYLRSEGFSIDKRWNFNDDINVSIKEILDLSEKYLPCDNWNKSVLHGDFCFSNILYDFRTGSIKTIDPRGITHDGEITIYGDTRYDIAKLSHSIIGMYDWIIAGYYDVNIDNENIYFEIDGLKENNIQDVFISLVKDKFNLTVENLYSMQIQLFLSMLPLHSDNKSRQSAQFANVFRLYRDLKGIIS